MRYWRCRCGKHRATGTMPPPQCAQCDECGSDLASGPGRHADPLPHTFTRSIRQASPPDGKPVDVPVCMYCHRTRHEIEHGESSSWASV